MERSGPGDVRGKKKTLRKKKRIGVGDGSGRSIYS